MRVRPAIALLVATLCLLPAAARAESSAAVPALTFTGGRADFADDGAIPHGVFGGGLQWVATRHIAVGPEVLYMVGPGEDRDVFRYRENLNGSLRNIAGISSANGRVVGLMPHPEHATEALTGPSDDGLGLFYSALDLVLAA